MSATHTCGVNLGFNLRTCGFIPRNRVHNTNATWFTRPRPLQPARTNHAAVFALSRATSSSPTALSSTSVGASVGAAVDVNDLDAPSSSSTPSQSKSQQSTQPASPVSFQSAIQRLQNFWSKNHNCIISMPTNSEALYHCELQGCYKCDV